MDVDSPALSSAHTDETPVDSPIMTHRATTRVSTFKTPYCSIRRTRRKDPHHFASVRNGVTPASDSDSAVVPQQVIPEGKLRRCATLGARSTRNRTEPHRLITMATIDHTEEVNKVLVQKMVSLDSMGRTVIITEPIGSGSEGCEEDSQHEFDIGGKQQLSIDTLLRLTFSINSLS